MPPLAPAPDPDGVWLGADGRDGWALVRALGLSADAMRRVLLGALASVTAKP